MDLDFGQVIGIIANIGVIAGIVFVAVEVRQNNRLLEAQARYSLRQYRSDIADTIMTPHILEAAHKYARNESVIADARCFDYLHYGRHVECLAHPDEDRPLFTDHNAMAAAVEQGPVLQAVESAIGPLGGSWPAGE